VLRAPVAVAPEPIACDASSFRPLAPTGLLKNLLFRRLLKKVQMQGGARRAE
jgi:hypothetical protein